MTTPPRAATASGSDGEHRDPPPCRHKQEPSPRPGNRRRLEALAWETDRFLRANRLPLESPARKAIEELSPAAARRVMGLSGSWSPILYGTGVDKVEAIYERIGEATAYRQL